MSYPFRKITKEEAIYDYNKLREANASELNGSRFGLIACDYLFEKHRIKTRYKNYLTKEEAWNEEKEKIIEYARIRAERTILRKNKELNDEDFRTAMKFKYGSINQFRPMVAKYIYKKFKPKRILDISAGWGNRMIAAMACDIDYIGIDSNKNLKNSYKKMYQLYPSESNIQIIINNSENVDYSKLPEYDMIFSSPPYYMIEKYEHMKDYKTEENFINEFFKPVIINSYKNLKDGGYLVLNMPEKMKAELVKLGLSKRINSIKMSIQNRNIKNGEKTFEYIYWIRKK